MRSLTEDELFAASGTGVRPAARPCACGDNVVCIPGEEALGVAAHNRLPSHQIWRHQGGMDRFAPAGLTVAIAARGAVA